MAGEFRYPLTRYCLRSGSMTLPQAMVGLFPESGNVTAVDTKTDAEYELTFQPPRTVLGLGELFRAHKLAVNDELNVRALDDGRFAITAVSRVRTPDYTSPDDMANLMDDLIQSNVRMTEQEIRAVFDVPDGVDVQAALRADGRFALHEGRWVNAASLAVDAEEQARSRSSTASQPSLAGMVEDHTVAEEVAVGAPAQEMRAVSADVGPAAGPAAGPERQAARGAAGGRMESASGAFQAGADDGSARGMHGGAQAGGGVQAGAGSHPGGGTEQSGSWPRPASTEAAGGEERPSRPVIERRTPAGKQARPAHDDPEDGTDAASLEVTELTGRFRRIVEPLGFQVEPLGRGQLRLVASMGRRSYKVLVQLLSRSERLDWADLLSKRRTGDARHLAVVGDHHALLRLTGPAELARSTLWSWQGLERLAALHKTVPLSPMDLEPHFERDGLFEQGLKRFEASVAERVAERGALSEVLTRLNQLRAPAVFLLEDLVSELNLPRDRVLGILERLSAAPFHLVARVDHGEFVLRQRVDTALGVLASYALSMKERLPSKHVEKLTAVGEPDLLIIDDEDLQSDAELTSEEGMSA